MISPPRVIEQLLASLGARPEYRDALLGDLAEELAERAARDGGAAACRWYRREALRAAPHLLGDGLRALRPRDVGRIAGIVLSSYVFLLLVTVLVVLAAAAFDIRPAHVAAWPGAILLALGALSAVAGGFIAAWLDDRAPLVSATALGVALACVQLVLLVVEPHPARWHQLLAPLVVIAGTAGGGALRVRHLA